MTTHFAERAAEYGITCNGDALKIAIERAIAKGDSKTAEKVIAMKGGTTAWRFFVQGTPFYAIVSNATGGAMTIYTQDMMRRVKEVKKRIKKSRYRKEKQ